MAATPPSVAEAQMTERGHYRFAAQEGARGEFWIVAEPAGDTIGSLDDRTLGFDLWPQATIPDREMAYGTQRLLGGRGVARR